MTGRDAAAGATAMGGGIRWWAFLALAAGALAADLWSKHAAFAAVLASPDQRIELLPGRFEFLARYNNAGIWSIGSGTVHANTVLAALSAAAVVLMAGWAWHAARREGWLFTLLLAGIAGGAAGNLHDRVRCGGVRDFLQVYLWNDYAYPTFNVADCFLVCGAIAMFLFLWRTDKKAAAVTGPAPQDAPARG